MADVDVVTQQNAALVELAAASAESLHEQAAQLAATVAFFRFESDATANPPARRIISAPRQAFERPSKLVPVLEPTGQSCRGAATGPRASPSYRRQMTA
jgi:methyl-accepting chemotaxis protein